MNHVLSKVANIRRPKVLNNAARVASRTYKRDHDLQKLISSQDIPTKIHKDINSQTDTSLILMKLMSREEEINSNRIAAPQFYTPSQHIAVLGAIIAETSQLKQHIEHARHSDDARRDAIKTSVTRQHRLHSQRITQDQTNVSGIDAFFSTRYASSASDTAGSRAGC